MNTEYRVVKTLAEIQAYIGDHKIVAFDYETAPDLDYRNEDRAALDPAKYYTGAGLKEMTFDSYMELLEQFYETKMAQ